MELYGFEFCVISARYGSVYASVPYQNFFLFLNFMPALTNIYYIHLPFFQFPCFAIKKYTGTSKFPFRALCLINKRVGHNYYIKQLWVCNFWFWSVEWQKPWNFANNLVNVVSKLIENEAFTCQCFCFEYLLSAVSHYVIHKWKWFCWMGNINVG
jgi:hypothetical protein